jgi:transposase
LLATVPGVGIMGAGAIAATVADPSLFRSGREFAAWLGMTPRQNSSGGKERLGRTSKRGDEYIRSLLTAGAVAVLRHARSRRTLSCVPTTFPALRRITPGDASLALGDVFTAAENLRPGGARLFLCLGSPSSD